MLLPRFVEDVDPLPLYGDDERVAPAGRPWVLVNMIATIDGATSVDGVSGPLGGAPDKRVFGAVRAVADVILVAAGTVRAERYGPPQPSDAVRAARSARGQSPTPRLAIVTRSLDLDLDGRIFADAEPGAKPIIVTTSSAPSERRTAATRVAEVVEAGADGVEMRPCLAALHGMGARVVLCEGGPSLVGQLVADDLVDEQCLTLAPLLASGDSARLAHGATPDAPRRMRVDRILEEDSLVFCRYVREA
jgi:riboflavin biosynthesis pyrimidine reductase